MKHSYSGISLNILALLSLFLLLAAVVHLFSSSIRNIENRKNALLLADQIMSSWSGSDYPEIGAFSTTAVSGNVQYGIRRTVIDVSPGVREMHVYVKRDGDCDVELVRKFYDQELQNIRMEEI